jgi:uncharacterized protein (DUF486 family)
MSKFVPLFGWINVSPLAAPYVVVLMYALAGCFLTMAWFFHLKFPPTWPWWAYVLVSWGCFAFCEYMLANQATRLGTLGGYYTVSELKTIQMAMALIAYLVFARFVLDQPIGWYHAGGFFLIGAGGALVFMAPR